MSEGKPKALFTPGFITHIKHAIELNNKRESKDKDVYYHPRVRSIIAKSIDLRSQKPMGEFGGKQPRSCSEERWLEAYLIREAKRNDWILKLAGKEYRFLSSQFTFRASPSLEIKGKQHRHVDLLLYDIKEKYLVVLELKKEADSSSLCEARNELRIYVNEIKRLRNEENAEFNRAFSLEVDKDADVIGHIVCPHPINDAVIQEIDLGEFRLIQYTKPWEKFEEVKERGRTIQIKFTCHTPVRIDS